MSTNSNLRLLAVFAHPDDETLGTGGTLARYSAEGIETHVLTATRGEKGFGAVDGSLTWTAGRRRGRARWRAGVHSI